MGCQESPSLHQGQVGLSQSRTAGGRPLSGYIHWAPLGALSPGLGEEKGLGSGVLFGQLTPESGAWGEGILTQPLGPPTWDLF